jgi:hypothetical protein
VSICPQCAGEAKVIASIEEQAVIDKILNHFTNREDTHPYSPLVVRKNK